MGCSSRLACTPSSIAQIATHPSQLGSMAGGSHGKGHIRECAEMRGVLRGVDREEDRKRAMKAGMKGASNNETDNRGRKGPKEDT